ALPIAEAQIAIDKLKYRSLLLTDISGAIGSTAESVRLSFPSFKTNGWSTSLKSQAEFSGSSQYTFELGMEALEAEAFHKTVSPGLDAHVKGRMKGLEIRLQSSGRSAEDLKRHLRGEIKAQFDRLELPGELQNVIPFNIIFAPFVVVGKTAELLPLSLIPDPIERTASGISTALDESQQVVIYEGEMKLEIADSKVMVSEFVIGTDLLPAVYFSGDVAFNGEISLSSGVSLMGVKVPLPIGGTLERPYPDVTRFVAELASAIGYNITNLPQNVLNQIGSLDPTGIVGSIFPEEGQQRGQLGDMD
ncbi:MAG: hypothetical protein J5J00_05320, partial [Deltaproteobacteria bacterium]|nr:hypothetical protein [Deltaproteobacteria bacterium]